MDSPLRALLQTHGLEACHQVLVDNDVDLDALCLLSEADLQMLGLSLGHRKKLLHAIAKMGVATDAEETSPAPVATAGERRQLTVMFCDMVGFTDLSTRVDPEDLQQIIRRYEDLCAACVTRYDGYVFQRLGDGIVAFFGYPLAHEGEAERAIHAGLAIIAGLQDFEFPVVGRLQVRIGIANGLVVTSADKGAVGETMNLAARLQVIAAPASIVVSEAVHQLAGTFQYEELGTFTLKGLPGPIPAFRVKRANPGQSRFEAATRVGLTPLVGREPEIAMLIERWRLAQSGEGQVVLLSGDAGIGKSRILAGLLEQLTLEGVAAVRFQCSPFHLDSAFHPLIEHLERALQSDRDEAASSKAERFESLLTSTYGLATDRVRYLAPLLGIPSEESADPAIFSPQKLKEETIRALVGMITGAARTRSAVVLFEDLHWADPSSLEVIDLLIDRMQSMPLLAVLTHRPEFETRWAQYPHAATINLSKLTRGQSRSMIDKLTASGALPAELLDQILTRTDGVPLFVEELTRAVLESSELKRVGDRFDYVGTARTFAVPATLRDSLVARLDRVPEAKEVAQIGAALGREFSHEMITAVAEFMSIETQRGLTQLIGAGLVFRRGTPPELTYLFKHALVQDAAYDSMLKSRRRVLHAAIAAVLEQRFPVTREHSPEQLAHHLTESERLADAIPCWLEAGELAVQRSANREAIKHLSRGLDLVGRLPQSELSVRLELDLNIALGKVLIATRGWASEDAGKVYGRASVLSKKLGEAAQLFSILWGTWMFLGVSARLGEALQVAEELRDLASHEGNPQLGNGADYALGATQLWLGNLESAQQHFDACQSGFDGSSHLSRVSLYGFDICGLATAYSAFPLWCRGYPERALARIHASQRIISEMTHPYSQTWNYLLPVMIGSVLGDDALIGALVDALLQRSVEHVSGMERALISIINGRGSARAGSADGLQKLLQGQREWEGAGGRLACTWSACLLADCYLRLGRPSDASDAVQRGIDQAANTGERLFLSELHRLRGVMAHGNGEYQAEESYLAAMEIAREQHAKSFELRAAIDLGRLWQAQNRGEDAHRLLAPICAWFTEGLVSADLRAAKALLQALSQG